MVERETIVHNMPLIYEGLFSVPDLYSEIYNWFKGNGYDCKEIRNEETVKEKGRNIFLLLEATKAVTDYMRRVIAVRIKIDDLTEVVVKKDSLPTRLNQGRVQVHFDGFVETDLENRWEMKPGYFVIKTILDKYIYKPFTAGPGGAVKSEVISLHSRVKAFLNLYRY